MFTGIIETTGTLKTISQIGGDVRLTIAAPQMDFTDVKLGDSIASNGICLTVIAVQDKSYVVDVSRETLSKTALSTWQVGDTLNIEKAMLPTTRFGGHIVAGHVDGVGYITKVAKDARSVYIEVVLPPALMYYTANKGSITVDGISLTTNIIKPNDNIICLNIIPHTAEQTNIARHWTVGRQVNVEVDLVARYIERLIEKRTSGVSDISTSNITEELLIKSGFIK